MSLAIEARLAENRSGVRADVLLHAPELAAEAGEPALPATARTATAPQGGLAELTRRTVQKRADDDSAALAKELLAATSHARRPDADMGRRVARPERPRDSTPLPE